MFIFKQFLDFWTILYLRVSMQCPSILYTNRNRSWHALLLVIFMKLMRVLECLAANIFYRHYVGIRRKYIICDQKSARIKANIINSLHYNVIILCIQIIKHFLFPLVLAEVMPTLISVRTYPSVFIPTLDEYCKK